VIPCAVPDFSYAVQLPQEVTRVFLGALGEAPFERLADTGCLVADSRLERSSWRELQAFVGRVVGRPAEPIVLEGGEALKEPEGAAALWRALAARGLDRRSLLVAAGGGSVLDAAAFAAATFLRGVPLLNVPTTLLAQLDAAIGGKCGINLDGVKNQVGVIRQPRWVVADPAFLQALPEKDYRSGLGELAKTALLSGGELHAIVLDRARAILGRDGPTLGHAVFLALRAKAEVVSRDPLDLGERAILNAGHTAGHVIEAEALRRGTPVAHGDAVALGLVIEARVDARAGRDAVREVLERLELPKPMPFRIAKDVAAALLDHDKKRRGGMVALPVIEAPGTVILRSVPVEALAAAIADDDS
jgi:3-dehydroquinate synthetase